MLFFFSNKVMEQPAGEICYPKATAIREGPEQRAEPRMAIYGPVKS